MYKTITEIQKTESEFYPSIKIFDGEGNSTRQMNVTDEQLKEIIKILKQ